MQEEAFIEILLFPVVQHFLKDSMKDLRKE
jgi:hypothetical protein